MASTEEIKKTWTSRLDEHNKTFGEGAPIQVRVDTAEFRQVIAEGAPAELGNLVELLGDRNPTHVLLWRGQLKSLIEHDTRKNRVGAADVHGQ